MRTARLPTVRALVANTRYQYCCLYVWGWGGPEVNKFEQVSSDDHQMSVEGEGVGTQVSCPGGTHVPVHHG